jgi:hypothetical protein
MQSKGADRFYYVQTKLPLELKPGREKRQRRILTSRNQVEPDEAEVRRPYSDSRRRGGGDEGEDDDADEPHASSRGARLTDQEVRHEFASAARLSMAGCGLG